MNAQCKDGSCSVPAQSGGNCAPGGNCYPQGGDCGSAKDDCCPCPKTMMCDLACLTKCAKKCLMKDKIKAKLDEKIGDKLDEAADIAVELFLDQWQHKVGHGKKKFELEEKMKALIMS